MVCSKKIAKMKIFVTFSFVVTCCAAQNFHLNQEDYRYRHKITGDEQIVDLTDTINEDIPQNSVDLKKNLGVSEENSATNKGSCNCAVFSIMNPTETTQPISVINAENVTCDKDGQRQCLKTCMQLKMERCPAVLCMKIGHAERFKAVSFISVCSKPWIYTGIASKTEMCCHEYVSVPCKELIISQYINNYH